MMPHEVFFPILVRRSNYSRKQDGTYYVYRHYRDEIREDCRLRCVYCDIHEKECGGDESMHLDHFRPKAHFNHLEHDPTNLVWTCPGCNRFKSDTWPALETDESYIGDEGFIDPFVVRRLDYFEVEDNGELQALQPPAKYKIGLLQLNRQSRIKVRRQRIIILKIHERLMVLSNEAKSQIAKDPTMTDESKRVFTEIAEQLQKEANEILALLSL